MTCIEGATLDFAAAEGIRRERLAASHLGRLLPGEIVVDLFCGAGGWTASEALRAAGVAPAYAVNHSPLAIEFHAANHPHTRHVTGDAWKARPLDVVGRRAKVGLLLASAACTTHSNARGAAPISPRVHMLGWCIARWMREAAPRVVLVENVPEWKHWGPLVPRRDERGRVMRDPDTGKVLRIADPARKGQHFRRWLSYCRRMGYQAEFRVLDAADFGNASRRKRLFVQLRRDGAPIVWPEVTHGCQGNRSVPGPSRRDKAGERGGSVHGHETRSGCCSDSRCLSSEPSGRNLGFGLGGNARNGSHRAPEDSSAGGRGSGLIPHRAAAEIIDWSDLGTSIFERKRALKSKTLARIAEGIVRFVLNDPAPFVLRTSHGGDGWRVWPAGDPMPTQTTRQDLAVCTPIIAPQNTGVFGQRPDQPGPTITTKGHQALIAPLLATVGWGEREGQAPRCGPVDRPLNTIPAGSCKQGVVTPLLQAFRGNATAKSPREPLPTITAGGGPGRGAGAGHSLGVVVPALAYLNHGAVQSGSVQDPLRTVVAGGGHAGLIAAFLTTYYGTGKNHGKLSDPLRTCTTKDRHGLVVVSIAGDEYVIVDILFRMLKPRELAAAMGFPSTYVWPKSQRDAVKLIGNAVAVPQAEALIFAALPGMLPGRTGAEVASA